MWRQGDVIIIAAPVGAVSDKAVPREDGRVVLAHGELTGHAHAIKSKRASLWTMKDTADLILRVGKGGAVVRHEEHAPISLPPGDYVVRRQREYTPERIITVAD